MDYTARKEFSLHLISNSDQQRHSSNVISDFTTTLNIPLQLQHGTWTCGLRSMSYPSRLIDIDDKQRPMDNLLTQPVSQSTLTLTSKVVKIPRRWGGSYLQSRERRVSDIFPSAPVRRCSYGHYVSCLCYLHINNFFFKVIIMDNIIYF